ncbi:MAG: methyltransferase domain-containing protein [Bacteroidetes bacterium]|nr:MAG: methyltransferase domain-containing protein [Bacteroidota bacterium]
MFIQRYYRQNAWLYDSTRWAFLFGRRRILWYLPQTPGQTLLEVGCGTGINLKRLAPMQPTWQLTGIDISPDMLRKAAAATVPYADRVRFIQQPYGSPECTLPAPADIMLFSYSLTMFNPGWEAAIEQAWQDLKPGGTIAVVDFHDTPYPWFRKWMDHHRVRMDRHLLPVLRRRFEPAVVQENTVAGGMWRYFIFVGKKQGDEKGKM